MQAHPQCLLLQQNEKKNGVKKPLDKVLKYSYSREVFGHVKIIATIQIRLSNTNLQLGQVSKYSRILGVFAASLSKGYSAPSFCTMRRP